MEASELEVRRCGVAIGEAPRDLWRLESRAKALQIQCALNSLPGSFVESTVIFQAIAKFSLPQ
jgi:hypothetical protein